VLVAEDDPGLRSVLARGLQEAGYTVDAARDGPEALAYLRTYEYAVAVLDWRIPAPSGLDLVRSLRAGRSALPVLLLTARDTATDRVQGLDAGADDYLVKPFDFGELLARIRALLRRPAAVVGPRLQVGDVELDPAAREAWIGDRALSLTGTEWSILEILLRRSPAVVGRQSIAVQVWEDEAAGVASNTIDVHVARLRSKLAGARARLETVRGVGYRLVPT
jgi:DNA-binding response OmpR family regulator